MTERERSELDPWDLKPVLASLRTGQISDRKAVELIVEWSRGLPFSRFAPAVETEDNELPDGENDSRGEKG